MTTRNIRARHDSIESLIDEKELVESFLKTDYEAWLVENHTTGETEIVDTYEAADELCDWKEVCAYGLESDPRND